jgi:hypothetical protein
LNFKELDYLKETGEEVKVGFWITLKVNKAIKQANFC